MHIVIKLAISVIIGYLLGSISFAVIMSRTIKKQDVREFGSGNAGATNVARVFGMKTGIATFLCDGIKTAASMYAGLLIAGENGFLLAAAACLIGHCYPIFFGFRGGKGVTVGAIIGLMIDWRMFLLLCVVFFTAYFISRRVSVCSISCAVAFPITEVIVGKTDWNFIALGICVMFCVIIMHRSNIKRLIAGTEPKFSAAKKK